MEEQEGGHPMEDGVHEVKSRRRVLAEGSIHAEGGDRERPIRLVTGLRVDWSAAGGIGRPIGCVNSAIVEILECFCVWN